MMLRNLPHFCSSRPRNSSTTFSRSFYFSPFRRSPRVNPSGPQPKFPSFREEVSRSETFKSFSEEVKRPEIRRQILFFGFGSLVAFSLAAKCTNNETDYWAQKLVNGLISDASSFWTMAPPTSDQMRRAKHFEFAKKLQAGLDQIRQKVENFPLAIKSFTSWAYIYVAQPLVDAKESRRICWYIAALNTGIWVAWQIPRLKPFMMVSFTHNPLSGLSYTMFTSMISHQSLIHLLFNCMALTSFGSATSEYLMREQAQNSSGLQESTIHYHLLAFLVSAGLFSALVSHVVMTRIRFPQLVAKLRMSAAQPSVSGAASHTVKDSILPSLGASGAIYSAVVVTALAYPQSEVALTFPPTPPFPIQWGVGALITMDIVGVLRGWRLFDHFAHLGGAVFGAFYYAYGPQIWNYFRQLSFLRKRPD